MVSFEITGTDYAARISCSLAQDFGKNCSDIKVTTVELKSLKAEGMQAYIKGSITIDGEQAAVLALTETKKCGIVLSKEYTGGGESEWTGFSANTVTVAHQDNGVASVRVKVSLSVYVRAGTQNIQVGSAISKTLEVELKSIPQISTIQALSVDLGQEMTIKVIRKSASFRDTITWRCGYQNGTIAEKTDETEIRWIVPMDLANEEPNGKSVGITFFLTTYEGSTVIGEYVTTKVCGIPASVQPEMRFTVTDKMGYMDICGAYVQNQSQALITVNAEGSYGSTISSIDVWCGRLQGKGNELCFAIEESGTVVVSVKVMDSRGRTAGGLTEITVLPYRKPTVTVTDGYRCDKSGNRNPEGDWLKILFNSTVTALTGNTAAYTGKCTVHALTEERTAALEEYAGQFEVTEGYFLISAGIDTGYDCVIEVQDRFSKAESETMFISAAFALMDFCKDKLAVGIGMRARTEQMLSIGLNTDMTEHGIENLLDPVNGQDAATKAYVDGKYRELLDLIQNMQWG